MICAYCNEEKGNLEYTDEDGEWEICEECYDREVAFFCMFCQGQYPPEDVDYDFITLNDGLYYGEVEWLLGSINTDKLKKIENADSEEHHSFVHGVCLACASYFITKSK